MALDLKNGIIIVSYKIYQHQILLRKILYNGTGIAIAQLKKKKVEIQIEHFLILLMQLIILIIME